MSDCLSGAQVLHNADWAETFLEHIGINDKDGGRRKVLIHDFNDLGSKLRTMASNVKLSKILPIPLTGLRSLGRGHVPA